MKTISKIILWLFRPIFDAYTQATSIGLAGHCAKIATLESQVEQINRLIREGIIHSEPSHTQAMIQQARIQQARMTLGVQQAIGRPTLQRVYSIGGDSTIDWTPVTSAKTSQQTILQPTIRPVIRTEYEGSLLEKEL
jgi:hypothetical protein